MSEKDEDNTENKTDRSTRRRILPSWMVSDKNETQVSDCSGDLNQNNNKLSSPNGLNLPFLEFKGTIVYSYQLADCAALCEEIRSSLKNDSKTAVGFDMEWPVTFQRGQKEQKVALLQLCLDDAKCYLFHLSTIGGFPKPLEELLHNERLLLVGVGIESDLWKLERDYDLNARHLIRNQCMDLSPMANEILKSSERWSLDNLCRNLFLQSITKDGNIRCGNWAQYPLTDEQKLYAATDAFVSLLIYQELLKRKHQDQPS